MAIKIFEANIKDIKPYENNPRIITNDAVEHVANSIKEFGMKVPIVVDKDMVIIAGHTRLRACESLGMGTVPCIMADDLTDEQVKAFRLADNKTNEFSSWDDDLLNVELGDLFRDNFDMEQFGFDWGLGEDNENPSGGGRSLADRFIAPPFSVLDTRQGYWQDRKKEWKAIINSHSGREGGLLGLGEIAKRMGAKGIDGTSVFDPVLTEILIKWFCPVDGNVIDCFAGGSVRGLLSTYFGRHYAGVDLSEKQIVANREGYEYVRDIPNEQGGKWEEPRWICGDSLHIDSLIEGDFDFLLTCPPYGDLEVYSDKPEDISNMPYEQFKQVYTEIIKKTCAKLKDNAFAAIVVGDIRDKKGNYRGFVDDTKTAFREAGLSLYNDCVLVEAVGTASVRAGRYFMAGRKVAKTHQNVLVFVKGDAKAILSRLQDCSEEIKEVLGAVEEECQEA